MKRNLYDSGLDQNRANFAPLSPLPFLQRAATVFPALPAVVHGRGKNALRLTWSEVYRRCRLLASRACEARHRARRYGGRDAAEHAGDGRSALRCSNDRGSAQCAEHSTRCGVDRVSAEAR